MHGPSGSGKSTLLNLMAGLDEPTAGSVAFEGLQSPSAARWTRLRAERIGLVFQDFNLIPTLTASENVEVAMFGRVCGCAERRRRALATLTEVGVPHCADQVPAELSNYLARVIGDQAALVVWNPSSGERSLGGIDVHHGTVRVVAFCGIDWFGTTNSLAPPVVRPPPTKAGSVLNTGEARPPCGVGNSMTLNPVEL